MNIPAHLIFSSAAFARAGAPAVTTAALAGAVAPDLSLFILAGWALFVLQTPAETVFGELYFSEAWQGVFAIDNSFLLWALVLGLGIWARRAWVVALAGSVQVHLFFDFILHADDARQQFWPVTDWVFNSPFSYWDRGRYAGVIAPLEVALSLILCVFLWRRFQGALARGLIVLGALAALSPGLIERLIVHG